MAVPVLRKKRVLPMPLPMKASRSPSASMSAKAGLALLPTLGSPKPVEEPAKEGLRKAERSTLGAVVSTVAV